MVDLEISKIPDEDRRQKVRYYLLIPNVNIVMDDETLSRAKELNEMGFKSIDAFHIACAEKDKRMPINNRWPLVEKAISHRESIKVRIENPLRWLMEELIKWKAQQAILQSKEIRPWSSM